MDIRLIALDLDGTLLDSQKRLSSRNRQALTECHYNEWRRGRGYERRFNAVGVYHSMGAGAEDIKNY